MAQDHTSLLTENPEQPVQMDRIIVDNNEPSNTQKLTVALTTAFYLRSLNIEKGQFTITGCINSCWRDPQLLHSLNIKIDDEKEKKQEYNQSMIEYQTINYDDLSDDSKKMLPFDISSTYSLFDHIKSIKFVDNPALNILSNGLIHFRIQLEAVFAQDFIVGHRYPYDKHILDMKLLYNNRQYELRKLRASDKDYLSRYARLVNIIKPEQTVSFSMHRFDAKQEWKGLLPLTTMSDNLFVISLRIMRNPNKAKIKVILPLFLIIGSVFSIYAFPYISSWTMRLFMILLGFIAVAIIHTMKESKRLTVLIPAAYSILAAMLIGSLVIGLSANDVDPDILDVIDILFAIINAVIWLFCVAFHCMRDYCCELKYQEQDFNFSEFIE